MAEPDPLFLYDTTLRDGTQGEGISFSVSSKLRLTEKLDQFGVDYIEGGWPGSNPRDMAYFDGVRELKLKHARIAAFGSTRRANTPAGEDGQLALLLQARTPVVTIFGKTWLLHITEVIRTTPQENLAMIEDSVRYLVSQGREVVYDAEHFYDGYKDDPAYALDTLRAAARGGAGWLVLCDTNGGSLVEELGDITSLVVRQFSENRVGVHCHNDSGLGVAVSLAGVKAGARMVQGTLNGYGERNGNANLTSIIPNLVLKLGYPCTAAANLSKLRDLSLFCDDLVNQRPDIRAPFVGASSFAHKGGVHADAANKVARSYEHIDPAKVGNRTRVLVSDMSGRSSLMMKARELGVNLDSRSPELKQFLAELKELEFRGYEFEAADASFKLLIRKALEKRKDCFEVLGYRVIVERDEANDELVSEATVKVEVNGEVHHVVAEAAGPVGALDAALRKAISMVFPSIAAIRLVDYKVRILESGKGTNAVTRVSIEFTDGHEYWGTVGASENIVEASWEALKDSVEYHLMREEDGASGESAGEAEAQRRTG